MAVHAACICSFSSLLSLRYFVAMNILYLLSSIHTLWHTESDSCKYGRWYRMFGKILVASFVSISDYDRSFKKKANTMMISYLCLLLIWWKSTLLFFLKHFYQPFCYF